MRRRVERDGVTSLSSDQFDGVTLFVPLYPLFTHTLLVRPLEGTEL